MGIILFMMGVIISVIYIGLYLGYAKKYAAFVEGVDKDFYFMSDCFVVGIAVVEIFKLNQKEKNRKRRMKIEEYFSKQYMEFNYMINMAAKITYALFFLAVACFLGALTGEVIMFVLAAVIAFVFVYYVDARLDGMIEEQRQEILLDYPNVLSKLALLINSGMMLRDAWQTVAVSGDRKFYREMQRASHNINNGYSEIAAYEEFAEACKINEIKKFVSIICQNIEKGSGELVQVMKELSVEAWNTKKNVAKMRGASASTKLILPIGICFIGILIMIIVPILMGMGM